MTEYEEKLKLERERLKVAVYFAKEFMAALGREKALDIIEQAWAKYGADNWKGRLKGVPHKDTLKAMGEWFKAQEKVRPELKVIESTPKRLCIEVRKCPTYDICQEMGVPEICQKYCDSDYGAASLINPKLKLVRDKELAYGANVCNHCWVIEQ